jgi:hypothetical protein
LEYVKGHIAFDFIEDENQDIFAIECNPRATLGMHLLMTNEKLSNYFSCKSLEKISVEENVSKHIATALFMYSWKNPIKFLKNYKTLKKSKDVIFSKKDILPFLVQPLLFGYYLYKSRKLKKNLPAMYTDDIDWNGDIDKENL